VDNRSFSSQRLPGSMPVPGLKSERNPPHIVLIAAIFLL
jgi:hypothetical protein